MTRRWTAGGGGFSTRRPPARRRPPAAGRDTFGYVVLTPFVRQLRGSRTGAGLGVPDPASYDVPPAIHVVRILVLIMVLVTVPLATPNSGAGPKTGALAVTLVVCGVSFVIWELSRNRPRTWVAALTVMGAAGGVLAGLTPLSTAVAVGFVVTTAAGARLPTESSVAITAETIAAFLITGLTTGADASALVGWSAGFAGMWAFGLSRRAYLLRAVEAEEALEQARRAQAAQTQAAALAERARIAREIHDVLAHALAAVSVNLQAAEGLLDAAPGGSAEVAKAMECVQRASALTREGMTETRRAILALRDDEAGRDDYVSSAADGRSAVDGSSADGGPGTGLILPGRLRALAEQHAAAGDAEVTFAITGQPRRLTTEAALTAYRTAQEALTNARKHAPGQPVTVTLGYPADALTLQVSNPLPSPGAARPLTDTGLGYGLTGLRERAALAGGTLTADPDDESWQVSLRIPG
jgi:signal transduction histidine kinase